MVKPKVYGFSALGSIGRVGFQVPKNLVWALQQEGILFSPQKISFKRVLENFL